MTITNLWQLIKLAKNWKVINGKLQIPDYDLDKVDIKTEYKETDNVRGEFMGAMTEEDFAKWQQQKSGWAKFYDKLKGNANKDNN